MLFLYNHADLIRKRMQKIMKKTFLRILAGLFVFTLSIPITLYLVLQFLNKTNRKILSSSILRKYLLYVPPSYNPDRPTPLVISFHGFAEWPAHQMEISRWNDLADEQGFIVAYPCGTGFPLRWRIYGEAGMENDPAKDVQFISDLIDQLEGEYNIDPVRIYANGLSNGGGMTVSLSCRLAGRIAAVGTVSGAFLIPWDDCRPSRPVPLIAFHGTADPIVPYSGGNSRRFDLPFPAIPDWIAEYARRGGCTGDPKPLPGNGEASGIQYSNDSGNMDVVFYTIQGGGHSWPGGGSLPKIIVGHTSQDIDATRTIWDFFQKHPLPTSTKL